eukprot:gene31930-40309_t
MEQELPAKARPSDVIVRLAEDEAKSADCTVVGRAKNPKEQNSAVESYFQLMPHSVKERATVELLEQVMEEACYDTLRTKEQLGYTVSCGLRLTGGVLGFCINVVSASYGPEHIISRIE